MSRGTVQRGGARGLGLEAHRVASRRSVAAVTALMCALLATITGDVTSQEKKPLPIYTLDQFVAGMKTIGQAFGAVNASLGRNVYDDSKAYLAISRDRLATTITFWRDRRKEDAIKML